MPNSIQSPTIAPAINNSIARAIRFLLAVALLSMLIYPTFNTTAAEDESTPQIMLGIWQPPAPGDLRPLEQMEHDIGRAVDIIPWYQAWGSKDYSAFRADKVQQVLDRNAIPMITWEPWDTKHGTHQPQFALRQIPKGKFDHYIWSWARGAAAIDGPILIRFAHEMNGNWYPWAIGVNGTTEQHYKDAWRHIVGIFRAAGADNVQFVWSPNKDYPGATPLASVYPGDDIVDWLAIDGYNFGTASEGQSWRSFNETFKPTYDQLAEIADKPVMIAETGSAEIGGDKAAWIREGLDHANLTTAYPALRAVVWFNQVGSGNWPVTSSQSAFESFADTVGRWP